jgi:hypothetical protein
LSSLLIPSCPTPIPLRNRNIAFPHSPLSAHLSIGPAHICTLLILDLPRAHTPSSPNHRLRFLQTLLPPDHLRSLPVHCLTPRPSCSALLRVTIITTIIYLMTLVAALLRTRLLIIITLPTMALPLLKMSGLSASSSTSSSPPALSPSTTHSNHVSR